MNHEPITEEWLKGVGFKWHQHERQPTKHWLLWLGDAMGHQTSFEDIGIELAKGYDDWWYCWLRGDTCHRYHRFIHVRHVVTQRDVIRMVEGLTGLDWNPGNHLYGSVKTEQQANYLRRESERLDIRLRDQSAKWAEIEKDDSRGRSLPEHMEAVEKSKINPDSSSLQPVSKR